MCFWVSFVQSMPGWLICTPSKEKDQHLASSIRFFVFCLYWGFKTQSTTKIISSWSVNLSTLLLGKLPKRLTSTKCPYFRQALLESAVGREWPIRGLNLRSPEHQSDDASNRVTGPGCVSQRSTFFWRFCDVKFCICCLANNSPHCMFTWDAEHCVKPRACGSTDARTRYHWFIWSWWWVAKTIPRLFLSF